MLFPNQVIKLALAAPSRGALRNHVGGDLLCSGKYIGDEVRCVGNTAGVVLGGDLKSIILALVDG